MLKRMHRHMKKKKTVDGRAHSLDGCEHERSLIVSIQPRT